MFYLGLFSTGEFKPCWASLQVCCCAKLHHFRMCQHMGSWSSLPNFWINWVCFWADTWYSFIQWADVCLWEAQEGDGSCFLLTFSYTIFLSILFTTISLFFWKDALILKLFCLCFPIMSCWFPLTSTLLSHFPNVFNSPLTSLISPFI